MFFTFVYYVMKSDVYELHALTFCMYTNSVFRYKMEDINLHLPTHHMKNISYCLLSAVPSSISLQVGLIQELTQEAVIECLRELVSPEGLTYRKLSVQVVGASDPEAGTPPSLDALLGECPDISFNLSSCPLTLIYKS